MDGIVNTFISFDGRLNRLLYLKYSIIIAIISMILNLIVDDTSSFLVTGVGIIISVGLAISGMSLIVRRLHDLDKSGYFALIALIPIVDFFFWLYLLLAKGTEGANRFGSDPLA